MKLAKRVLRRFGLRISRMPANRFEAATDVLLAMRERGFSPRVVVDGGANRGQFFGRARPVFRDAVFHLIEPQPACMPDLEALAREDGGEILIHRVALTEPAVDRVRMVGGGESGGGDGNWVAKPGDHAPGEFEADATTLDTLLDARISPEDRTLLKLDLEHHELAALSGATRLLEKIEAVFIEVSFFDINEWGAPLFDEVVRFLGARKFSLYELASLSGRARDGRLRMGDAIFVRAGTVLARDTAWE